MVEAERKAFLRNGFLLAEAGTEEHFIEASLQNKQAYNRLKIITIKNKLSIL